MIVYVLLNYSACKNDILDRILQIKYGEPDIFDAEHYILGVERERKRYPNHHRQICGNGGYQFINRVVQES